MVLYTDFILVCVTHYGCSLLPTYKCIFLCCTVTKNFLLHNKGNGLKKTWKFDQIRK